MKSLINKSILIVFFSLLISNIWAGNPVSTYAFNKIPQKLLLNANAVIRTDELIYTIENKQKSKVKVKQALTLLNELAADYTNIRIPYDKFISISNIKATVYDSKGDIILSARPDIMDMSANYDELASDQRYWLISFPLRKYPYTIEYEYEETIKESFFIENWNFQPNPDVSVERSGIQFIMPKESGFRVKALNLKHSCDTFSLPDKKIYSWLENNIPAYKPKDLFLISLEKKQPLLITAPNNFNMGGYEGNMETWESLGRWSYELNKGRDSISTSLQNKIKNLIADIPEKKEQIKRIYEYLQKTTRYVSIQLGIGGYQTLDAGFVEKKGFGDCKALTNYMKAMLKSVGIKSYQALVKAGENSDFYENFPSNQFDHVILCVPCEKDTLWLECTSQSQPFNFLGSFTDNRYVLLLTENGGKLIKTPQYDQTVNYRHSIIDVETDVSGNAKVNGRIKYSGLCYEEPLSSLEEGKKEREAWINGILNSPTITIDKINYDIINNTIPAIDVHCELFINNFSSVTSKRMFINPLLFNPTDYLPKFEDDEFTIPQSKTYNDTIIISIPFGYIVKNIPQNENIESQYGKFQNNYQILNDKIYYTRNLISVCL